MITVGIVDDEALIREGISTTLNRATDIRVVGEANDGIGAIELVRSLKPQILVLDTQMPVLDGLAAAEQIRHLEPATSVILLTAGVDDRQVRRAVRAGIAGFLLKGDDPNELISAVRATAAGLAPLSPEISRRVLDLVAAIDLDAFDHARVIVNRLTRRQREVLRLLGRGYGNAQIADELQVSEGAVKAHIRKLLMTLSCANRVEAALVDYQASLAV